MDLDWRQRLADVIAAEHPGRWREDLGSITGTRSDREIVAWIEALVERELGETVVEGLFAGKSVGAVFGLALASGDRVVLKLFHPMFSRGELEAMQVCLTQVIARGFPAPSPLSPLFSADQQTTGGFYAFATGELRDGHDPGVRRELARSLAQLTRLTRDLDTSHLPLSPTRGSALWPTPHRCFPSLRSPKQDPTGIWIDDIGRRAQQVIQSHPGPLQPAHLDWGVKNVRFQGDRISVVYDWDSLHAASEAEVVGRASVEFTTNWESAGLLTPTGSESAAFVEEYEAERGRKFDPGEREVMEAAADYLVAQIARQEHDGGGPDRQDSFLALLCERAGTSAPRGRPGPTAILDLLPARRGHFLLESGHHGELWLDLELLCFHPGPVRALARELTRQLRPFAPAAVCGPLVEGAFVAAMVAEELDARFTYAERRVDPAATGLFPVRYQVPAAQRSKLQGFRVAIVNDVINAGSAVRGTLADLRACGAEVVAIASLAVLGSSASQLAQEAGVPLVTLATLPNDIWVPAGCPLCARRVPLDRR